MARAPRKFDVATGVRAQVPLLIGLTGPSNSGKTKSALRLADGMTQAIGGDHYVIDTESRRALHYADEHKFKHIEFNAPYGSLDYLDALRQCVKAGASVITIDSTSHEHESEGGMLDLQEQELTRMAGDNWEKREKSKFAAWIKPKRNRTMLLQGILTMNCNFIFCFRAREKVKPIKKEGKTEFVNVGFQAIAGEEFLFEQTVNCLLLPGAKGVPTWQSSEIGERQLIKLPKYLQHCFRDGEALNEKTGELLARWAKGGTATRAAPDPVPSKPAPKAETPPTDQDISAALDALRAAATNGQKALEATWYDLANAKRRKLLPQLDGLKTMAEQADLNVARKIPDDQPAD